MCLWAFSTRPAIDSLMKTGSVQNYHHWQRRRPNTLKGWMCRCEGMTLDVKRSGGRPRRTPELNYLLQMSVQYCNLKPQTHNMSYNIQYELLAIQDEVCRTSHHTRSVNDNLWAKESKLFITCLLFIMLNVSLLLNVLFIRDQTTYKSMSFPQNHECCFIYLFLVKADFALIF